MAESLKDELAKRGYKAKTVAFGHVAELKKEIEEFAENEALNGFQQFIVSSLYSFDAPADMDVKSVVVIALPIPAYAKTKFNWNGKVYPLTSLARYNPDDVEPLVEVENLMNEYLGPLGHHIAQVPQIPLKRLAARSGLAVYGRNNICYVDGLGSFTVFAAFFTDMPCMEDDWTEIRTAEACSGCKVCMNSCPTGAIRKERFLIDNERCISCMNEMPGEFPDWLPLSAHNCVYDCLKCQKPCPMNKPYINNVIGPIVFSEEETGMLLAGAGLEDCTADLAGKLYFLGMDQWISAIPRNLKVLMEQYDSMD